MPFESKIQNGITKAVMREGLKDMIPPKIRFRYIKLGFESPEAEWMNANPKLIERELEDAADALYPLLNKQGVLNWYRNLGKVKRGDPIVWRIVCAGRWTRVFSVKIGD